MNPEILELLVKIKTLDMDQLTKLRSEIEKTAAASKAAGDTTKKAQEQEADALKKVTKAIEDKDAANRRLASNQDAASREDKRRSDQAIANLDRESRAFRQYEAARQAAFREDARRTSAGDNTADVTRALTQLGYASGVVDFQMLNATRGVTGLSGALGVMGLAAGAGFLALTLGAKAALDAAQSVGNYAQEVTNAAARTGLGVVQYQEYAQAAEIVGVNANALTTSMRTLSKGLSEGDEQGRRQKLMLSELGIQYEDALHRIRPMNELLPEIGKKLGELAAGPKRDLFADTLLGRGGLELVPVLARLGELVNKAREANATLSTEGVQSADRYIESIHQLGLAWDGLKRTIGQKVIGVVEFITAPYGGIVSAAQGAKDAASAMYLPSGPRPAVAFPSPAESALKRSLGVASAANAADNDSGTAAANAVISRYDSRKTNAQKLADAEAALAVTPKPQQGQFTSAADAEAAEQKYQKAYDLVQKLKDSGKETKQQDQETISLRQELASLQAKELTGIAAIEEKRAGIMERLREEHKLNTENVSLLNQIVQAETARYNQQVALAQVRNGRATGNVAYDATRSLNRARTAGQAQLDIANGKYDGDEEGGINAAYNERLRGAGSDYQDAQRRIQQMRQESAEREALQHDQMKLDAEAASIEQADIKASGQVQLAFYDAQKQKELELTALQHKRFQDALEAATSAKSVTNATTRADIADNRNTLRLRSRIVGVNAEPGQEVSTAQIQAALAAQAARADAAERQADITTQRNALQALNPKTSGEKDEVQKRLNDLRAAEITNQRDLERELGDERIEIELKVAEVRKQQLAEYKSFFVGLVNAGLQGGRAVTSYFSQFGHKILDTVTGNVAGLTFDTAKKLAPTIPGQTDAKGNLTTLGKVLQGTPLGKDQTKLGQEAQTTATRGLTTSTDTLRASVDRLTGAITGRGGAGTAGGGSGGIGSIGSIGSAGSGIGPEGVPETVGIPGSPAGGPDDGGEAEDGGTGSIAAGGPDTSGGAIGKYGKDAAIGAGVAFGIASAVKAFSQGGARNVGNGVADVLGAGAGVAALIPGGQLVAGVLGGAAALTKVITGFLGDPRQQRANAEAAELSKNQYLAPTALNVTEGSNGTFEDFGIHGNLRTSSLNALPTVAEPYIHYNDLRGSTGSAPYYDVPGSVKSPYSGSVSGPGGTPISNAPQVVNNYTVHAMDVQSFHDYLMKAGPSASVGEALANHIQSSSDGRAARAIQYTVGH